MREKMKAVRERKGMGGDRPPVTCYACNEVGHISTYCPKKKDKTVVDTKTAMQSNSKADSMHAMQQHTQHMTDEQVKLLALTLIAQRDRDSRGEGVRES